MKTIVRSLALLVVLSSSGAIAQTCPIAQPQLDGINASLLGSPPGIPAGLSTAQTMASLYGEPCISSLLSGLTYVLYDQPSYSAQATNILTTVHLMSGSDPIADDRFFRPMLNAYSRAGAPTDVSPAAYKVHSAIAKWMLNYAKTTSAMNNLNDLVDAFWPAITHPSGVGADEANVEGFLSTIRVAKSGAILSTLEEEMKKLAPNTYLRSLGALSFAGAGGAYAIGDVLATIRCPPGKLVSNSLLPIDAARALQSSHDSQQDKDRALERLVDGGINQLTAPCAMDASFPMQFAKAVGSHGKRAIPALQQRANLAPGTYGFGDVGQGGSRMAIAYLQSVP